MESILTFTGIIVIVFGILQIILFFKIWGMTNDVKVIKDKGVDLIKEAQVQALLGNNEKAYELLYTSFIEEVCNLYHYALGKAYFASLYKKLVDSYKPHFALLNMNEPDFSKFDSREKVGKYVFHKDINQQ